MNDYIGKHRDNTEDGKGLGAIRDGLSTSSDPTCPCGCGHVGRHRDSSDLALLRNKVYGGETR